MQVRVHGLVPREGDAAFAFLVLRLSAPVDRSGLVALIRQLAPLLPDAETFVEELPEDGEDAMRLVGLPWSPPAIGDAFEDQRRLIEGAAPHGIEEAWFFQTGTSLPAVSGEEEAEEDDSEDDAEEEDAEDAEDADDADDADDDEAVGDDEDDAEDDDDEVVSDDEDDDDEDDDDEDEADDDEDDDEDDEDDEDDDEDEDDEEEVWSHGPPPQATQVRFPVDGYPEILAELDWEDFGIAFKLAGPWTSGETTVLLGFHAMWLTPYGGRYRNAAVTIDERHHAAHLWVDRFAVPCSAREQVHHLLWVVSKLDEVIPVLHARFGGATMAQKYGGILGDPDEPFVLGGNPLIAVHTIAGEGGVDAWMATQTAWSKAELAQMLRELAVELATARAPRIRGGAELATGAELLAGGDSDDLDVDAVFEAAGIGFEDDAAEAAGVGDDADDNADADGDDGEGDDGDDDDYAPLGEANDGDAGGDEPDVRGDIGSAAAAGARPARRRPLTIVAGELLTARAQAGLLDPRVAEALRPLLGGSDPDEHRRTAVVSILGAARDLASVPAMIRILEATPPGGAEPRMAAAAALAACLAAARGAAPPALSDEIVEAGRRALAAASPAILGVAHAMIDRAHPDDREHRRARVPAIDDPDDDPDDDDVN